MGLLFPASRSVPCFCFCGDTEELLTAIQGGVVESCTVDGKRGYQDRLVKKSCAELGVRSASIVKTQRNKLRQGQDPVLLTETARRVQRLSGRRWESQVTDRMGLGVLRTGRERGSKAQMEKKKRLGWCAAQLTGWMCCRVWKKRSPGVVGRWKCDGRVR